MQDHPKLTIHQARAAATTELRAANIETAALDARVLLAYVLGESRTGLLMRDPEPIAESDLHRYQQLVQQRSTGAPVAYLIGEREFMGLTFRISPGVLVPRPDTEPLVEWGLRWLRSNPTANVADIGTGSGAIAVSMVHHADPEWTGSLIATDVSDAALQMATANADALLSPEKRPSLEFVNGSLTEPLTTPVDLLLTNLPYLTPDQIAENPDLIHEPRIALDGGDDGLDLVRRVIDDLPRILAPDGAVGFELDPSQSDEVQRLLAEALPNHQVEVVHDLAGDERHVVAFPFPTSEAVSP